MLSTHGIDGKAGKRDIDISKHPAVPVDRNVSNSWVRESEIPPTSHKGAKAGIDDSNHF